MIELERRFHLFYTSDDGHGVGIARAVSTDGVAFERHGPALLPSGEGPDGQAAQTPCVTRLRDGSLRMWYSGLPIDDTEFAYRICEARFPGPWPLH